MKKSIFYIPAIIFTILYGTIAMNDIGSISPIVFVWLALFFISGIMLNKHIYWGSLFGMLPALHLIYMGTQDTGQIISETPIGIAIIIFYIICGLSVYRNHKAAKINL